MVSCLHRGGVDSPVRARGRQLLRGRGLTERSFLRVQGGSCHKDGSRTVHWRLSSRCYGDWSWRQEKRCLLLDVVFLWFHVIVIMLFLKTWCNSCLCLLYRDPHSSHSDWVTGVKGHWIRTSSTQELQLPVWDQQVRHPTTSCSSSIKLCFVSLIFITEELIPSVGSNSVHDNTGYQNQAQ